MCFNSNLYYLRKPIMKYISSILLITICLSSCQTSSDKSINWNPNMANSLEELKAGFKNPPIDFSTAPLWVWNDDVSEEKIDFQLAEFKHRESSGIQITRHPGQNIFYLGCLMLIVGIFMMFYISYQRVWLILKPDDEKLMITFAGSGNRNQRDFAEEFEKLASHAVKTTS